MTKSRGLITRVPWTEADDQVVLDRYANERAEVIAEVLGRAVHTIYSRAKKLGIQKSEAFMAGPESGRARPGQPVARSEATRFSRGNPSWNKGTTGICGHHPNSRRSQFQKGQMSGRAMHNYVAIGTEKVTVDGYLVRKITDDPALVPTRRWEFVHRLVWVEANGPIPAGYAVVFRPGRKTAVPEQITVDVLELVSRRELMLRNSYHTNYPKEVAQLIQLKGALTRKINGRSKP